MSPRLPSLLAASIVAALAACGGGQNTATGPAPHDPANLILVTRPNGDAVGHATAIAPEVLVTDLDNSPLAGVRVGWTTAFNDGTVSPGASYTDSTGHATTTWTLGTISRFQILAVTAGNVRPDTIVEFAFPDSAVRDVMLPDTLHTLALYNDTETVSAELFDEYGNRARPGLYHWTMSDSSVGVLSWPVVLQRDSLLYSATLGVRGPGSTTVRMDPYADSRVYHVLAYHSFTQRFGRFCGAAADGLYCWGSNYSGALGVGDSTPRTLATRVVSSTGLDSVTMVSPGYRHTCAIDAAGHLWCWGNNDSGELGSGDGIPQLTPFLVADSLTFIDVSAATDYTCAVSTAHDAYCWGRNFDNELGIGPPPTGPCTTNGSCTDSPVPVAGGLKFAMVSSGPGDHSCGVTLDGAAYCWGKNASGQLGTNAPMDTCIIPGTSYSCSSVPLLVQGGYTFSAVTTGGGFSCGLTTSQTVYCWGSAYGGATPQPMATGTSFSAISSSVGPACGVSTQGTLICWASSVYGGATTTIRPDLQFVALSVDHEACGLRSDGLAACFAIP